MAEPGRLPPPLRPGDLVAAVAPAGPADPALVAEGTAVLESWGLVVRPAPDLPPADVSWLAGTDEARARAVEAAWCDPDVAGVWCLRGGVGCHRVVDLLDRGAMREAGPRVLVGYSDVTALHQALATGPGTGGARSIHGAGLASLPGLDAGARAALRDLVMDGVVPALPGRSGRAGRARGPLVGGNLTVLAAGAGTPGVRTAAGAIALLEDVGERPYRLDRALTQLRRSGWFDGVVGVACGQFTDCGDAELVRDLLGLRLGDLGVPVVTDLPLGHEPDSRAVPLGVPLALDGDAGVLSWAPGSGGPGAR